LPFKSCSLQKRSFWDFVILFLSRMISVTNKTVKPRIWKAPVLSLGRNTTNEYHNHQSRHHTVFQPKRLHELPWHHLSSIDSDDFTHNWPMKDADSDHTVLV